MTGPPRDLRCERAGLLLSLRTDGATTPDQAAELDAHLAECAACRRAAPVDAAVGDRLRARAAGDVPGGFAARVVAAAVAQRAAAAAQNRFLRWAAAAAVVVACATVGWSRLAGRPGSADAGGDTGLADARDAARVAVLRPRFEGR